MVYWGSPTFDNDGSTSFAEPVELKCLWVEKIELVRDEKGKEIVSRARVYVNQDLEENGMVYRGEVADLTVEQKLNPVSLGSAYEVLVFTKTPSLVTPEEYNRVAYI